MIPARFKVFDLGTLKYVARTAKEPNPELRYDFWTYDAAKAHIYTPETYEADLPEWPYIDYAYSYIQIIPVEAEQTDLVRLLGVEPKRSAR